MRLARSLAFAFELYGVLGVLFAVSFLPRAVAKLDPRLTSSSLAVRVMILPGVVAFWPLFTWRWLTGSPAPLERNAHRARASSPHQNLARCDRAKPDRS